MKSTLVHPVVRILVITQVDVLKTVEGITFATVHPDLLALIVKQKSVYILYVETNHVWMMGSVELSVHLKSSVIAQKDLLESDAR